MLEGIQRFNDFNDLEENVFIEEQTSQMLNNLILKLPKLQEFGIKDKPKQIFEEFCVASVFINKTTANSESIKNSIELFFKAHDFKKLNEIKNLFSEQKKDFEEYSKEKTSLRSPSFFRVFKTQKNNSTKNMNNESRLNLQAYNPITLHDTIDKVIDLFFLEKKKSMNDALTDIQDIPIKIFLAYDLSCNTYEIKGKWYNCEETRSIIRDFFSSFAKDTHVYDSIGCLEKISQFNAFHFKLDEVEKQKAIILKDLKPLDETLHLFNTNQLTEKCDTYQLNKNIKFLNNHELQLIEMCNKFESKLTKIWNIIFTEHFHTASKYTLNTTEKDEFRIEYEKNLNERKTSSKPGSPKVLITLVSKIKILIIDAALTSKPTDNKLYFPKSNKFSELKKIYA